MFSRVVGAGLALIAAAVLAAVMATPLLVPAEMSLFAGHPTVNGRLRTSQEVYVGLYEARLCNRGGDGTCKSGNATVPYRITAYSGLGTTGILMLGSVALALSVFTKRERRSRAVWVVRLAAVATLGAAAALLVLGPFDEASVPIGIEGVALYGGGIVSALLASFLVRPPPPLKLRVAERPSQPLIAMAHPSAPVFDPSMFASDPPPPQLRPLYDAPPMHGGTGVPMSHALVSASTGLPLPASESAWAEPGWADAPKPPAEPKVPPVPSWVEAWAEARPEARPDARPPPRTRTPSAAPPGRSGAPGLPGLPGLPGMTPANGHGAGPASSGTGTDQSLFANLDTPLAEPPSRDAPSPRARVETPLAEPPPPVGRSWSADASGFAPPFDPRSFAHGFDANAQYHASLETVRFEPPAQTERFEPTMAETIDLPPQLAGLGVNDGLGGPTTLVAAAQPAPATTLLPTEIMPAQALAVAPADEPTSQIDEPTSQVAAPPLPPPPVAAPAAAPIDVAPVAPVPPSRAVRDTLQPRPAPETQAPRPVLRAAVPMPERNAQSSARIPAPATRPPPVPPPRRAGGATVPPAIPRIPAIPMVIPTIPPIASGPTSLSGPTRPSSPSSAPPLAAPSPTSTSASIPPSPRPSSPPSPSGAAISAVPAIAAPPSAADLEDDRPNDAPTSANIPIEITDNNSQTNVSVDIPLSDASETGETIAAPAADDAAPEAVAPSPSTSHSRSTTKPPLSTAPESLPPPKEGKLASGPVPACPQCESPMAWVEEHLRFYCKSCRMYF